MSGPALVQHKGGTANGAGNLTVTLTSNTTAGNCLVVCISFSGSNTATVSGVTIGGSADNFSQLISKAGGSSTYASSFIWADPNCAGGQTSVQVTMSTTGCIAVDVYEFSGLATSSLLDKSASANSGSGTGTSWSSGATATTTRANEVWVGVVGSANSGTPTITGPSSPWTNEAELQTSIKGQSVSQMSGYQIATTNGTATYSGSLSSSEDWAVCVVTLKAAPVNGIEIIQAKVVTSALSGSFSNNTTAGNCVAVIVNAYNSSSTPSVSSVTLGGSAGNFAQAASAVNTVNTPFILGAIWVDPNCAGGQTAISVTGSNLSEDTDMGLILMEISGLATSSVVDKTSSAGSSAFGTSWSSGSTATTSQANEIWIGVNTNNATATQPSSPWTNFAHSALNVGGGYQIVGSTGTATYNGTQGSAQWAAAVVTLKTVGNTTSTGSMSMSSMAMAASALGGNTTTSGGLSLSGMTLAGAAFSPQFPQVPLGFEAELDLNGTWTDVTEDVYQRNGAVTITRGRPDESTSTNASQANVEFNNQDGRFSPRNPNGAYYGSIGRNTPLRLSVPEQSPYLRMEGDNTSSVSTPTSSGLSITGDTDIRIDLELTGYTGTTLASKFAVSGNERSWCMDLNTNGTVRFQWSGDGTNVQYTDSTMPIPVGRIAVRVTLAVATGTVTFYTAPNINGSWTQLGNAAVLGALNVFASTTAVVIGYNADRAPGHMGINGQVYGFQLLSGIGGTVKASPDFTAQSPGASSFADAQGNTWTLNGTSEISNRLYRFHGEVAQWPQKWDVTGTDVYTPIQANGLLRRLGQGTAPLNSAMYRGYVRLTGTETPVAYWPCEDGSSSTQLAAAIGPTAMHFTGSPTLAGDSSFVCSGSIPQINTSTWYGPIPNYTNPASSPANVLRFLLHIPSGGTTDQTVIANMYTNGSVAQVTCTYGVTNGGSLRFQGYNAAGSQLFDSSWVNFYTGGLNGQLLRVSLELTTSGSSVNWAVVCLRPGDGTAQAANGTLASSSVNVATRFTINPNAGSLGSTSLGHISYQSTWDTLFDLAGPLEAWVGETAANRFYRLCTEQGIACRIYGSPDNSRAMGVQSLTALTQLLQECEDADKGMMFEPRQALAMGYRTRESMENQTATVTLNYASADLGVDSSTSLEPTDDDQFTRNDITVQRSSSVTGSSSRQVDTTSLLSINAPPNGVGEYNEQLSVNLYLDSQVNDQAGWMLHLGTVNEPRYPAIPVNLARAEIVGNNTKYYGLQDVDQGDFIDIQNPPSWLPPGDIKQIVAGVQESLGGFVYTIEFQCIPESPYEVGVVGSGASTDVRVDTDGSTLSAGCTSSATSITVAVTSNGNPVNLWTTNAADMPFDIMVGGERMTVTNITGSSSPQTFTVTRSVNGVVKAHNSGETVDVYDYATIALDDPY